MTAMAILGLGLIAGGYLALGALVALWLLAAGLERFDRQAARAPFYVKALWAPGLVLLWPILVRRALGIAPKEDRS